MLECDRAKLGDAIFAVSSKDIACRVETGYSFFVITELPSAGQIPQICASADCQAVINVIKDTQPTECASGGYMWSYTLYREILDPIARGCANVSAPGSSGNASRIVQATAAPSTVPPPNINNSLTGITNDSATDTVAGVVPTTDATSSSTSWSVILTLTGAVVVLLALALVYRARNSRSRAKSFDSVATPTSRTDDGTTRRTVDPTPQEYLPNDVRNDATLIPLRIDQHEIQLIHQVARGGFGAIYRGTFQGRSVAVKRILPDQWRNGAALAAFMDEIRMCARLDHARIVRFVGITWSSLRDISVITEFMNGGDLHALLRTHARSSVAQHWVEPWGSASTQAKPKVSIATDVTEAVVYLHSFNPSIIHRDLKAKNVLLDHVGNAKLSDFGISREMSMDETMTSEIGTAAWIAPEVLRGERYSEKADIYSLGVLLVELDRCSHPYASHSKIRRASTAGTHESTGLAPLENTQLALLVSAGQLSPSTSPECPAAIASLVTRCVAFDASTRPSALEVCYALRQIAKAACV